MNEATPLDVPKDATMMFPVETELNDALPELTELVEWPYVPTVTAESVKLVDAVFVPSVAVTRKKLPEPI